MRYIFRQRLATAVLLACFAAVASQSTYAQFAAQPQSSALSIPNAQLIQPEQLSSLLRSTSAPKPLVLQVGSHVMFAQAHIPGSEYVAAGSQASGSQQLRARVASLPRSTFIVLYCGCCPWNRCPNVGPAYSLLVSMGFTHVKVLYIADNFGADWVNKGLPVATGN